MLAADVSVTVITEQVEATCIMKVRGQGAYQKLADLEEKSLCAYLIKN